MRKSLKLFLAVAMSVAVAAPAMAASVDMTGFYRAKGYVSNFYLGGVGDPTHSTKTVGNISGADTATGGVRLAGDNSVTSSYVDQRWRGKISVGDENVKAVTFLEISGLWGGTNADLSGDSTSAIAVKNVYLWFKVPDAPVDVTAGLQNVSDPYNGVFMGAADVAGVFANVKPSENLALRFAYAIPYTTTTSGSVATVTRSNSVKLYIAEAKLAPTKELKIGANMYFLQDGGGSANEGDLGFWRPTGTSAALAAGTTKLYMPGVDFVADAGMAKLTGFVFTQFGERKYDDTVTNPDKTKFGGYAANLRADLNAGAAKCYVEGLYVSGNSFDPTSKKYKGVVVLDDYDFGTTSSFSTRNEMYILTPAADSIGTAAALTMDANNHGLGVVQFTAGVSAEVAPKTTAKLNVGYLQAAKKITAESTYNSYNFKNKSDMGTEINATINYNLQKGLDVSLTGAYAFLGKAYDHITTGTTNTVGDAGHPKTNFDDPYALVAKVNYAY